MRKKNDSRLAEAEKKFRQASVVTDDGVLAETVFDPKAKPPVQFAVHQNGKVTHRDFVEIDGQRIEPPNDSYGLVSKGILLLPSEAKPCVSIPRLISEIQDFIHHYADVEPFLEKLIAHYALMTWVYDRFSAVPYLRFLGEPGTGKSRLLQVAGNLCYKAIVVGAGMTVSPFFRLLDFWRGTFAIDEAELGSESSGEIIRILNAGYMKGSPLLRSEVSGNSFDGRAFEVYGPKLIANRTRFHDESLESRCLTIETTEGSLRKDIPRQLPPTFFKEAGVLRNKFLHYRFENYKRIKPDESKLACLEPRRAQIAAAIYAVASEPFRTELIAWMKKRELEERDEKPQNWVAKAILKRSGGKECDLWVKDVATEAQTIWQTLAGAGLVMGYQSLSAKRVGGIIRSLGFTPQRTNTGYKFTVVAKKLRELKQKYGP
jgi:hypothetical protein